MPLKPNTTLKGYTVVERIGSGGMAEVYLATQLSLDRQVAIKEMKADFADAPGIVEQFELEAKTVASLRHSSITHVYDYWQHRNKRYIVMELVKGVSVDDLLERSGPLPWHLAAEIIRQSAKALHYAHERGLIHLDVKPSNLMVTYEGKVKLMDFGISRLSGVKDTTLGSLVMGSPGFMAPEQISGEPRPSSDQYSLGVTFYGLLCNELPFDGDDLEEVRARMKHGSYVAPRRMNRALPRKGQGIARRMIRQRPLWRYRNLERVAKALDDLLNRHGMADGEGLLMEFLDREGWIPDETAESGLLDSDTTVIQKRIKQRRRLRRRARAIKLATVTAAFVALLLAGETYLRWNFARAFPRAKSSLVLDVRHPVWIAIDGTIYSALPRGAGAVIEIPTGVHQVTLRNPLYVGREETVTVEERGPATLSVPLENRIGRDYRRIRLKLGEYWERALALARSSFE